MSGPRGYTFSLTLEAFYHKKKVSLGVKVDIQVMKYRFLKFHKICDFLSKMCFLPKKNSKKKKMFLTDNDVHSI